MSEMANQLNAAVIGSGLVGNLTAVYLARRNYRVDVYEKYGDPRHLRPECARSINLTVSHRGEEALRKIGLHDDLLGDSIPAFGRVAWTGDGKVLQRFNYGERGESIRSIRRFDMNVNLMNIAEAMENITIHFKHELSLCDFDAGTATFLCTDDNGETRQKIVSADLLVGADGAHSAVRAEMMKHKRLDYLEFKYHEHYYTEMLVPSKNGHYQLEESRLHVWPKDKFVLICLPNLDKSFSGTLVMPEPYFERMLKDEKSLIEFFRQEFPQVFDLVEEQQLIQHFKPGQPDVKAPCRLVTFKCEPYHAASTSGSKCVLLGDAAHAMVPFYGQGMNTGFEDVQILNEILDKHDHSKEGISAAIEQFSKERCKDGQAMSEISYDHYKALCSNVKKRDYNVRRRIDSLIHNLAPHRWLPEYSMVAFSSIPQSRCMEICKQQDRIMSYFPKIVLFMVVIPFALLLVAIVW